MQDAGNAPSVGAVWIERQRPLDDACRFGMGARSQRYSLIANDGVVEQLNVEQGGEFRVSSAEYLL